MGVVWWRMMVLRGLMGVFEMLVCLWMLLFVVVLMVVWMVVGDVGERLSWLLR